MQTEFSTKLGWQSLRNHINIFRETEKVRDITLLLLLQILYHFIINKLVPIHVKIMFSFTLYTVHDKLKLKQ